MLLLLLLAGAACAAQDGGPEATKMKNAWTNEHYLADTATPPFSFRYDGRESGTLLAAWGRRVERSSLDAHRTRSVITWTDPSSGLEVRCVAVDDSEYPAVEWTAYLRNGGRARTALIQDIQGIDAEFRWTGPGECTLHGIKGDWCAAESFQPYRYPLSPGVRRIMAPDATGKSCDGQFGWPYFNVQVPGGGIIMAVGWPGYWKSAFQRGNASVVRVIAGQARTQLVLEPGEEVRTPLIALLFWKGSDVVEAQNIWRRWYRARVLPRVDGAPQPAVTQIQVNARETDISYVQGFLDAGITPDICWRDAGGADTWYVNSGGPHKGDDVWQNTGTWELDPQKYPNGMRPFSDWVRARGMQFLLWLEPERVGDPSSWLALQRPGWLLPGASNGSILNLGNPEALNWLIDHVDGIIKSQGLDWYREDMNGPGPLAAWRLADAPDRQGITENLYVQGYLALWDELRRRNPGLRIDSCASGGRRDDLESMRRAVPLLRSDFQWPTMRRVVEGNQGHTYGLSSWLPFQGTGVYEYEPYAYRSFYLPLFGMGTLTPQNTATQKKAYEECRKISTLMLEGDYYPLTDYSLSVAVWIAWQFNQPETGAGVVQAFRRPSCAESSLTVRLRGLDPTAMYELTDFDAAQPMREKGSVLMEKGLVIRAAAAPAALIVTYRRAQP